MNGIRKFFINFKLDKKQRKQLFSLMGYVDGVVLKGVMGGRRFPRGFQETKSIFIHLK